MSGKRPTAAAFSFAGATPATRTPADAPADTRPDVRADTPTGERTQAQHTDVRPRSGPGAYAVAVDRAQIDAERRARDRARRDLDAAARSYQAHALRLAGKLAELLDAAGSAESVGMTLEEVRAVCVLAGLPADIIDGR